MYRAPLTTSEIRIALRAMHRHHLTLRHTAGDGYLLMDGPMPIDRGRVRDLLLTVYMAFC